MRKLAQERLALFAVLVALVACASAQRMSGAMPHFAPPAASGSFTPGFEGIVFQGFHGGFAAGRAVFPRFPGYGSYGGQYFPVPADWFNPDDVYAADYPVPSPVSFVVVQNGPATLAGAAPSKPPAEPLLIELQGGRYVHMSENEAGQSIQSLTAQPSGPHKRSSQVTYPPTGDAIPIAPLPSVILVFGDGSRQEVHDYTIADGALYARGDLYTDGYWNKKIELSALNIPETLSVNNARGVKFALPSSPNEVITRP